jgi:hypothetical protein
MHNTASVTNCQSELHVRKQVETYLPSITEQRKLALINISRAVEDHTRQT